MDIKFKNVVIDFENKKINVEYKLIKTTLDDKDVYGFIITTDNEGEIFSEEFLDFTDNLENANEVFEILIKNNVLPLNLINVLDNLQIDYV